MKTKILGFVSKYHYLYYVQLLELHAAI